MGCPGLCNGGVGRAARGMLYVLRASLMSSVVQLDMRCRTIQGGWDWLARDSEGPLIGWSRNISKGQSFLQYNINHDGLYCGE